MLLLLHDCCDWWWNNPPNIDLILDGLMFVCNWHQARATSYIFVCLRLLPSKFTNLGFTLLLSLFIALVWENSELLWTCLVQTDFLNPEVLKALLANSCQCPLLSLSCQLVYQSWQQLLGAAKNLFISWAHARAKIKDCRFWNIVTWIVALSEFHQHCTLHFGLSIRWLRLVIWLSGAWVRKLHISTSNTWHLTSNRHPTQL